MRSLPKLSPTSYALLGLLMEEPRSAYDLNGRMQNSLMRVFWPRAESHVYSEPKKLVTHKLVSERRERVNGRTRSVYTVTAKGRTALEEWLQQEGSTEMRSPSELILKLLLTGRQWPEEGKKILEISRDSSFVNMEQAMAKIEQILQTEGDIEAEAGAPWNGITINLMVDMFIARYQWSKYALQAGAHIDAASTAEEKVGTARAGYALALKKLRNAVDGNT